MAITDEQYNQIIRYVDETMDVAERQAFEFVVNQNRELYDEVIFYKEILSTGDSINAKIIDSGRIVEEQKSTHEGAWSLIVQARQKWETSGEEMPEQHLSMLATEARVKKSRGSGGMKWMSTYKWLAAAVVAAFMCFSVIWWSLQHTKDNSEIAVNNKGVNSKVEAGDNKADSEHNPSTVPNVQPETRPVNDNASNRIKRDIKYKRLFRSTFRPDSTPRIIESSLEEPLDFYAKKNYKGAIESLEVLKAVSETRGEQSYDTLTLFQIHYYSALSYMASNNMTKALRDLKTAVEISPARVLKIKAQWYLALAYVNTGEVKKAQTILKTIILYDQTGEYGQKARKLIEDLGRG